MITVETIIEAVALHFNVSAREIKSPRRQAHLVHARRVAMSLARELTEQSYPAIGRRFRRDHTTVLAGVRQIDLLCIADPIVAGTIEALRDSLTLGEAA